MSSGTSLRAKMGQRLANGKDHRATFHRARYEMLECLGLAAELSRRVADIMRVENKPTGIGLQVLDPPCLTCRQLIRLPDFDRLQKARSIMPRLTRLPPPRQVAKRSAKSRRVATDEAQ